MPVLFGMRGGLRTDQTLRDQRIVGSTHLTKETAVLIGTLRAAGANVAWCASNPATAASAVVAFLAAEGVTIFSPQAATREAYYASIEQAVRSIPGGPTLVVDDGGDLIVLLHEQLSELGARVHGGTDKTTTGVNRARALKRTGKLLFPLIAVNDSEVKRQLDNVHGTGQSALEGIMRATAVLLAGKTLVVSGFGHVGRGTALRGRGMGARVIVTEVRPTAAFEAVLEGMEVLPMDQAAVEGDIFITATGMKGVIRGHHIDSMKDGAILANIGHFDCEIDLDDLQERTSEQRQARPNVSEHRLSNGHRLYLVGEGRVVNLAAAEGNASEVMDLTFAAQVMALQQLVTNHPPLARDVHRFSAASDEELARLKLNALGVRTDRWTPEQEGYAVRNIR